jgi:hypothetical protein
MIICDYGCGQEGKHQFKNGKWCCSSNISGCHSIRKKQSKAATGRVFTEETKLKLSKMRVNPTDETRKRMSLAKQGKKNHFYGKKHSEESKKKIGNASCGRISYMKWKIHSRETRKKISKVLTGKKHTEETCRKISIANKGKLSKTKFTTERLKKRYPFLFVVEELRDNFKNRTIQGRCKNHDCKNSKEKNGWFTLTYIQLYERIRALENPRGVAESNFYCSQECKNTCSLYGLRCDPRKDTTKPHTPGELSVFIKHILNRDNYICCYCGKHANTVHHLRPQKLEPFFALDPDYSISCCKRCHYKYGHPTDSEYSTGNLSKIVCSEESKKFLKQNKEELLL